MTLLIYCKWSTWWCQFAVSNWHKNLEIGPIRLWYRHEIVAITDTIQQKEILQDPILLQTLRVCIVENENESFTFTTLQFLIKCNKKSVKHFQTKAISNIVGGNTYWEISTKISSINSGHILGTKDKFNHIKCKIFLLLRRDVQVTKLEVYYFTET